MENSVFILGGQGLAQPPFPSVHSVFVAGFGTYQWWRPVDSSGLFCFLEMASEMALTVAVNKVLLLEDPISMSIEESLGKLGNGKGMTITSHSGIVFLGRRTECGDNELPMARSL